MYHLPCIDVKEIYVEFFRDRFREHRFPSTAWSMKQKTLRWRQPASKFIRTPACKEQILELCHHGLIHNNIGEIWEALEVSRIPLKVALRPIHFTLIAEGALVRKQPC